MIYYSASNFWRTGIKLHLKLRIWKTSYLLITKRDVIGAALWRSTHTKGKKYDVNNTLWRQNIAPNHRSGVWWV